MDRDRDAENCWDYWKCLENIRQECAVFIADMGWACWKVVKSFKKPEECPSDGCRSCNECEWYQEKNSDER